jgi:hypothetical protein
MESIDNLIQNYFSTKKNYRFYSYYKKCIDKVCCNGHGAANLCRFIMSDNKCLINKNIANNKDMLFIETFCNANNFTVEIVSVDFNKNNL